jgi:metal-dependent amidase/aminoacylase/carboxypeptidase family protein
VLAAATVMRLQTVVSREISADDAAVVTVGTLHAGTKENIIPDDAELTLNIRSFDPEVRTRVLAAVERIIRGEAAASGAPQPPEISTLYAFRPLVNDDAVTARVADAFAARFGVEQVVAGQRLAGSEDFGVFGERGGFPSLFWFVGGADPAAHEAARAEGRDLPSNHSPLFAPVLDPVVGHGVETLVTAALQWLGR